MTGSLSVKPETARARWRREDLTLPIGFTALYRIWDAAGALLYIGITGNPVERWRKHAQKKSWWRRVDLITCELFPMEYLALDAERAAIRAERPEFNIRSAVA